MPEHETPKQQTPNARPNPKINNNNNNKNKKLLLSLFKTLFRCVTHLIKTGSPQLPEKDQDPTEQLRTPDWDEQIQAQQDMMDEKNGSEEQGKSTSDGRLIVVTHP
jgi:hypothetical protein